MSSESRKDHSTSFTRWGGSGSLSGNLSSPDGARAGWADGSAPLGVDTTESGCLPPMSWTRTPSPLGTPVSRFIAIPRLGARRAEPSRPRARAVFGSEVNP